MGAQGLRHNERDVFNNIFVQMDRVPGVGFAGKLAANVREGGNLLWGVKEGPQFEGDLFDKFRASPLFTESQNVYAPGWTTQDRLVDPRFVSLPSDRRVPADLRLRADSPGVNSGQSLPPTWPDPLRSVDANQPDIGALPLGTTPWRIGIDGRMSLSGERSADSR